MTLPPSVHRLLAEPPLRVWSLIVTIFGDAVMDRGTILSPPPLPAASLMALLGHLGIEPGPARTSLSRLVAGGTLVRTKSGRNTFYRLAEASAAEFAAASRIIYADPSSARAATGRFQLVLLDRAPDRIAARARLEELGFRFIGPMTAFLPEHDGAGLPALPHGMITALAPSGEPIAVAAREAWQIDALQAGYRRFVTTFAALSTDPLPPEQAVALRIASVHVFRRLALRDPGMPPSVLPEDWAGEAARALASKIDTLLRPASEDWLMRHGFRA